MGTSPRSIMEEPECIICYVKRVRLTVPLRLKSRKCSSSKSSSLPVTFVKWKATAMVANRSVEMPRLNKADREVDARE